MPTKAELIAENERLWSLLIALTNAKPVTPQQPAKPEKTAVARRANAAAFGFSGGKWNPENAVLDLQALKGG